MKNTGVQLAAHVCKAANEVSISAGKHIPRGWSASVIGDEENSLSLNWDDHALQAIESEQVADYRLRITNAVDYRDEQLILVKLKQSSELIGTIDVRYSYVFQYFEFILDKTTAKKVVTEGLVLSCSGEMQQLWIFNDQNKSIDQHFFVPHILVMTAETTKIEEAIHSLLSFKSIQPFGWIEGCVLDGIDSFMYGNYSEKANQALDTHLGQYVTADGELVYEDLYGNIADGSFTTIEATLPVAIIAKRHPHHPLIEKAAAFFKQRMLKSALIIDHDMVSAEGCYTVAYPLAVIAKVSQNESFAKQAIGQILLRKKYLTTDQDVYLRYMLDSQSYTFKNWSRAYGWYYLGLVKTYCTLMHSVYNQLPELDELQQEIVRMSELVLKRQQPHGLWNVFLDRPDTIVETSGSSAIAAAMAISVKEKVIGDRYLQEAEQCYRNLVKHLTNDGLLSGVSQHNAGGMQLQLSGYRVLSQMGLGLWGQLHSALYE
ncbi:glycoside hydrolase family 88 protein [Paenibacillus nasutitermitis]|uniref:Glycosyl hydrolase n=1 Tax=Paenibacillus nasutitermitis TaxID=1652958 RepID=A0A916YNW6_9BACL|nr:glycoside hydrolase family 88 protein [Paenibacillus nasutitermitis]GGD52242.1 hypothetical protein GCM10010911_07180 [Paenibacillus nasutitermitis]